MASYLIAYDCVKVQKSDQTGDWTQDLLDIYQML